MPRTNFSITNTESKDEKEGILSGSVNRMG